MKSIGNIIHKKHFLLIILDSNKNQIYYEDEKADIWWVKQQFDSNDNKIYYENSDEFWSKLQYDSNGKRIYYENSDGYIEDNRS